MTDRPDPGRRGELPRDLDDVTADWVGSLLANRHPGLVVRNMKVLEVINSHTTKVRVELDLNDVGVDAGIPRHVCLKSNWSDGVETGDITQREARFYAMVDSIAAPVPRAFYADWDEGRHGRGVVVLEDLGTAPGAFGASTDHLGVDGVAAAIESLAEVHTALWDVSQFAFADWLPGSMACRGDTEMFLLMYNYAAYNLTTDAFRAVLPEWIYDDTVRLAHAYDALAEYERGQPGPRTLVHGDAHQGNSFLRADGGRVWVDWQIVRQGSPWRDVNYLMLGALTVDERRGSARDLVEHHRQALLRGGATDVPSAETAWQNFVRWPVYGMQTWLCNIDQWGQESTEMVRRFFTAAEDYDSLGLLLADYEPRREIVLGERAVPLMLGFDDDGVAT